MTAGTYGGGTVGTPWGWGAGLYFDNQGRIYPQLYGGTPGIGLSAGCTMSAMLRGRCATTLRQRFDLARNAFETRCHQNGR
jgi:hypothetical protein